MFDETRVSNNIEIIRKIKNNEVLTKLDAKTYSGWGGMRDAIFTPSIYKQLKELLSDEEIDSIKATTGNAYYTPQYIAQFMWKILTKKLGFYGGDILEPAAGIGVFLDTMPASLKSCNIDSIEIDMLTATILRQKHHNINIACAGFEKIYFGNKKYDLIISNPPYGKAKLFDESQKDLKHLYIHHYFLAKSARLLKDNGIIAMVLPSFVLDNNTQHARDIIAEAGVNLILAYRLPDDLFNGATVTVDIAFFKKCNWNDLWTKTIYKKIDNHRLSINQYYENRENHILGTLAAVPMYDRIGLTCKPTNNLQEQLENLTK